MTMTYQTPLTHFLRHATERPEKPFLHQPVNGVHQTYTFADTEQQARKLAGFFQAQGYVAGDRVGILAKNSAHWFITDLAIMMAGLVSVPIYATAGKTTIEYVIEHSAMKAMVVGNLDSIDAAVNGIHADLPTIAMPGSTYEAKFSWADAVDESTAIEDVHQADIDDCMSIVYTSGTTGAPKGVVISFLNLASAGAATSVAISAAPGDRVLSYLPLAHITERCVVEMVAYEKAVEVFFVESLDTFIDNLKYAAPTFFLSVPRLWVKFQQQILAKMPPKKLNFLLAIPFIGKMVAKKIRTKLGLHHARVFASGSAPISVEVLKWYQKIGVDIGEGWGMSETSGLSCGNFPFESKLLGTIGRPVECVKMKLSDEGEILISGDGVFKEYYLSPKITAESFTDEWFHTGDKGEITEDGAFKIIGRIKEQFKTSKGKYVVPVPIERMLAINVQIEQACVIGYGRKQPLALVVLAEGIDRNHETVQQSLQQTLDEVNSELESHQRLDYLFLCKDEWSIENELLTPTLKLKRAQIEEHYQALLPESSKLKIIAE